MINTTNELYTRLIKEFIPDFNHDNFDIIVDDRGRLAFLNARYIINKDSEGHKVTKKYICLQESNAMLQQVNTTVKMFSTTKKIINENDESRVMGSFRQIGQYGMPLNSYDKYSLKMLFKTSTAQDGDRFIENLDFDCFCDSIIHETFGDNFEIIIIDTSTANIGQSSGLFLSQPVKFILIKKELSNNAEFKTAFAKYITETLNICKKYIADNTISLTTTNNEIANYVLYINDAKHDFRSPFGSSMMPAAVYGLDSYSPGSRICEQTIKNGSAQWQMTQKPMHGRSLHSVYLPDNQKKEIIETINSFFDLETIAFYKEHNINSKLAMLFYGVPGTGKTSLIKAIANHYKLAISTMNLSSKDMTDDGVRDAFQSIPAHSILVIEEIDAFFTKNRESAMRNTVTFSSLLDAIDGGISHSNQLIIMTTNHKERLDPAILRPGRIDVCIAFDYITEEQVTTMTKDFRKTVADEDLAKFASAFMTKFPESTPSFLQSILVKYRKESLDEIIARIRNNTIDASLHTQKDIIAEKKTTQSTSGYIY